MPESFESILATYGEVRILNGNRLYFEASPGHWSPIPTA
jgi:hypothetical protein